MSTSLTDRKVGTVQTTDTTLTTILTYACPDASVIYAKAVVTAFDASGNGKGWEMALTVKRTGGGAATTIGTLQSLITAQGDAGLAAALATVTVSGNNLIVQVTGIALDTINWRSVLTCDAHTP